MKPAQIVSLVVIALLAGAVLFLAMRNPQPPLLPPDPVHATFDGAASCMVCHGPEGVSPQSVNHPLGDDCLRCHGRP